MASKLLTAMNRDRASVQLNLTSMIDVVFQLLIYFLLGTNFVIGEQSYRMDLPVRTANSPVTSLELDEDPLIIEVRHRNTGEAAVYVPGPWSSPRTVAKLREFLFSQRIDQGGLYSLDHPIKIKPMGEATWEDAVEAFNAAFGAGYEDIGFTQGGLE